VIAHGARDAGDEARDGFSPIPPVQGIAVRCKEMEEQEASVKRYRAQGTGGRFFGLSRFYGTCMKHYIRLAPALALFTAGCSGLDGMFSAPSPAPVAFEAPVASPAPIPDQFCEHVAENARAQALAAGFDAPTQERLRRQSLQQCAQLHA